MSFGSAGSSNGYGYSYSSSTSWTPECTTDNQCAAGFVCIGYECTAGCRSNVECDSSSECVCNTCVPRGCHSDADCDDGQYCPSFDCDCQMKQCEPLPGPVDCGDAECKAVVVRGGFGDSVLAPCCTDSGCGVDVGGFANSVPACQRLGEPGASDYRCTAVTGQYGTYPGCRRSDDQCGFDPGGIVGTDMAFGCLLSP
jgi:hypothetical protein